LSYCHFRHGLPETARRKLSVKNGLRYCPVSTVKSKKSIGQCVLCLCAAGCPENGVQRAGLYAGWELVFRLPMTAAD